MTSDVPTEREITTPPSSMTIKGVREPRYWRETTDEFAHWVSDGQAGPPIRVVVTHLGVQVVNPMSGTMRPSTARWVALRMIEGAGIYEAMFGGDSSIPKDGVGPLQRGMIPNTSPVGGDLPPEPESQWVCGCGKRSTNKGAMTIHERTCDKAPAVLVTGGQD